MRPDRVDDAARLEQSRLARDAERELRADADRACLRELLVGAIRTYPPDRGKVRALIDDVPDAMIDMLAFAAHARPDVACREIGRWAREHCHAGIDVTTAGRLLV